MNRNEAIAELAADIHANAIAKGWWDGPRNIGESLALIHAEVSEALEAKRAPEMDGACDKCDGARAHTMLGYCAKCAGSGEALAGSRFAEELADIVIRVLDLAEGEGIDIAAAIEAKHAYNKTRPRRHGKAF